MSRMVRVASAQYPIEFLVSWDAYEEKIRRLAEEAASRGAELMVFPEYASLELASLFPESVYRSLSGQLSAIQEHLEAYLDLFKRLSRKVGAYILAGTFPVRLHDGTYRNRAHFFSPDGNLTWQDKIIMTRFERERWGISSGTRLQVMEARFGRIGICICYDSEFPLLGRMLAEAGAQILLVPSCTDSTAAHQRVSIGCRARALENQCYVVQSPTVGVAEWSEALDINIGAAAIYSPPDLGFPEDGMVVAGELNRAQWVFADLDLDLLHEVRRNGQALNFAHWPEQTTVNIKMF